jgi:hypothetical protein
MNARITFKLLAAVIALLGLAACTHASVRQAPVQIAVEAPAAAAPVWVATGCIPGQDAQCAD